MGDLSKDFSSAEFACPDCGKVGSINPTLVQGLQELRDLAQLPVKIHSGWRCPEHNAAVGGQGKSQHLLGTAADISIGNIDEFKMFALAEQIIPFRDGGIGVYKGFIHVDVRLERARWARLANGNYSGISNYVLEVSV